MGDGNIVNAHYQTLHNELNNLKNNITSSSELNEEEKLNLIADIETIKDQLAKPTPNKTIIKHLWKGIEKIVTGAGFIDLVSKITPLIASLV